MEEQLTPNAAVLKGMELFRGLDTASLERIAASVQPLDLADGETPYQDGKVDERFFLIVSGRMRLASRFRPGKQVKRSFTAGYFFGAENLLYGQAWLVSAEAAVTTRLYQIEANVLRALLRDLTRLRGNMHMVGEIYRLAYSKHFSWLNEDETIVFVEREHLAYLFVSLLAPVALAWVSVLPFYIAFMTDIASFRFAATAVGGLILALATLWGGWRWLDWSNDYYILTSQRVLWLEQVILLYDSRREAPLTTIQSVDTFTSFIGRELGYGSVTVRTYTSSVLLHNIGKPKDVKALVEKHRDMAREGLKKDETKAMEREIRKRIGLPEASAAAAPPPAPAQPAAAKPAAPGAEVRTEKPKNFAIWLSDYFKTRIDENGVITYRKHWFTLLRRIGLPTLAGLAVLAAMIYLIWARAAGRTDLLSIPASLLFGFLVGGIIVLIWLYQYIDWRNDIYQITADKIIDSERKPLGDEKTKSAPLENIQSLEHDRVGLIGLILNFGNVVISVGSGDKFLFREVHDPARAQQDIFDHMYALRRRKEETEANKERTRVADWVSAYHRQVNTPEGG